MAGISQRSHGTRHARKRRRWPRRLLFVVALCVVVLALVVVAGRMLFDRLPAMIAEQIEERYPVKVEIGSISYHWPLEFEARNLAVRREADDSPLLDIRRVQIGCHPLKLVAGSLRLSRLLIDRPTLTLRLSDQEMIPEGPAQPPPSYPIEIRGLALSFDPESALPGIPPLEVTDVGVVLKPEASRCLSLVASGVSNVMGRFWSSGILGGRLMDSSVHVSFPEVLLADKMRSMLPESARDFWDRLRPEGKAELSADISIPRNIGEIDPPWTVTWQLAVKETSLQVPRLSQRMTDVHVTVEGGVKHFAVTGARARYGGAFISGQANSVQFGEQTGFRVVGSVHDAGIGDEIIGLFGPKTQQALRRLHLSGGKMDMAAEMRFAPDPSGKGLVPDFLNANLNWRGARARPEWFPYPIERVSGACRISLDEMVITSPITGWHDQGSLMVSGSVGLNLSQGASSELIIEARGLAIDDALRSAAVRVGPGIGKVLEQVTVDGGKLDATVMLQGRVDDADSLDWSVRLGFDGLQARMKAFPYDINGVSGEIQINPDRVTFRDLTGRHGDGSLHVSGWLDPRSGKDGVGLSIRGENIPLDRDLRAALTPDVQTEWDRIEPRGHADVQITLSPPEVPGKPRDLRIQATLRNVSLRIPIGEQWMGLSQATGSLESFGDVIRLTGLDAVALGGRVRGDATLIRGETVRKLTGRFSARSIGVRPLVEVALEDAEEHIRSLQPTGQLTVHDLTVDAVLKEGAAPDLQYAYDVELHDAGIYIPMSPAETPEESSDTEEKSGRVNLSEIRGRMRARSTRGRITEGTFELERIRLLYGTMREVVGTFRKTGPMFFLDDVRGRMYGGEVRAGFKGASDLQFFSGFARVGEMDVAKLANEAGITGERIWGSLNAAFHFNGERRAAKDKPTTWHLGGNGFIKIDRANLGQTPLVRSVFSYKTFLLGGDSTIEQADATFEIDSNRLVVDKLVLSGPSASTQAVGHIRLEDEALIDLYFYRKRKGSLLPDIILIEWLGRGLNWAIDQLQNTLVVIRVSGPLGDPKVTAVPAKDLVDRFGRFVLLNLWEQQRESKTPE
jgi:hypothetical protein